MPDTLEEANSLITRLQQEAATATNNLNSLTTAHATLTEQHETIKNTLNTTQTEIRTLKETSGGSVKTIEELNGKIAERDTIIANHGDELQGYTELKTTHQTVVDGQITAQKERLKAKGLTDEELEGKDQATLAAMEIGAGVNGVKPTGTVSGSQNGLSGAGGGDGSTPPTDGLEASKQAIARAKQRKPEDITV